MFRRFRLPSLAFAALLASAVLWPVRAETSLGGQLDQSFADVQAQIDTINAQLDQVHQDFQALETETGAVSTQIAGVQSQLNALILDLNDRLNVLEYWAYEVVPVASPCCPPPAPVPPEPPPAEEPPEEPPAAEEPPEEPPAAEEPPEEPPPAEEPPDEPPPAEEEPEEPPPAAPPAADPDDPGADSIGYWNFDEGSGTTAQDSVSTNDGTLQGGMGNANWVEGLGSTALTFDGINDRVNIGVVDRFDFNPAAEVFTISLWMRAQFGAQGSLIAKQGNWESGTAEQAQYQLYLTGSGFITAKVGSGSKTTAAVDVADGQWHQIGLVNRVVDGEYVHKIYIDGVPIGDNGVSGSFVVPNCELWIGIRGDEGCQSGQVAFPFGGEIDEVRIWDRALSGADMAKLYAIESALAPDVPQDETPDADPGDATNDPGQEDPDEDPVDDSETDPPDTGDPDPPAPDPDPDQEEEPEAPDEPAPGEQAAGPVLNCTSAVSNHSNQFDAWLDKVEAFGSGHIDAGTCRVPSLRARDLNTPILITADADAVIDFQGGDLADGSGHFNRWSNEAGFRLSGGTWKNCGMFTVFASDGGQDGETGKNRFWHTPSLSRTVTEQVSIRNSNWDACTPIFFRGGGSVSKNFDANTAKWGLRRVLIENVDIRNATAGIILMGTTLGDSSTLDVFDPDNSDPVVIIRNVEIRDIDGRKCRLQQSYCGSAVHIGRNYAFNQDDNGGILIEDLFVEGVYNDGANSSGRTSTAVGVRVTGMKNVLIRESHFKDVRWQDTGQNLSLADSVPPKRRPGGPNVDDMECIYAKVINIRVVDVLCENGSGFDEGGISFKGAGCRDSADDPVLASSVSNTNSPCGHPAYGLRITFRWSRTNWKRACRALLLPISGFFEDVQFQGWDKRGVNDNCPLVVGPRSPSSGDPRALAGYRNGPEIIENARKTALPD